ncbi:MAG: hypothetical protein NW215_10865 [Hyphomicrobiales bacterium]|nr:hypothetical protein [Hyphomicrobiales bacterium]
MTEIVTIHAIYELSGGAYRADVTLDFGDGPERVDYGVTPGDDAPVCAALLAAIAAGDVTPEPPPAPVASVPMEVTNFQARSVLMGMPGLTLPTMLDEVSAAISAQGGQAWQAWEYANTVSRDGVLVGAMAAQLGLTAEQLDQMFITAATITA